MKRKFISALMFGALIVASSGTFVSCSDNDDDIAILNEQASSLKSQLEKQVTALDEAKAALEEEIKTAKESASSALAKAEAAQQNASTAADEAKAAAVAEANTYAQQAADEAAKAAAAEAKKQAVEEATAAAQALINSIDPGLTAEQVDAAIADKLTDVIARIKALEDADYLTLSDLSDYLKKSDLDLSAYATKEELQTAINELRNQYVAVEKYNEFINTATSQYASLTKLIEGLRTDVDALKATFTGAAAEKWNKTSEQLTALLNGFSGTTLQEALTAINSNVAELEKRAKTLEDAGYTNTEDVQKLIDAAIADIKSRVESINNDLLVLISQELRSLVFQPDFYYQGIEAIKAATYHYNAITLNNPTVSADDTKGINDGIKSTADVETSMVPNIIAWYHLNPSHAVISTDKSRYTFNVLNSEFLKSTTDKVSPEILKAEVENGMVKITASYSNAELIKNINKDGQVTVMALQYKLGNDTTITSDYAAIRSIDYTNIALAYVKDGATPGTEPHLYPSAWGAVNNGSGYDDVEIAWNGTVDLDSVVQAHYVVQEYGNDCIAWDGMAATKKVEEAGFKYKYELVGYTRGNYSTSQSAHAAISDDGHTLRAQMPKDGRQAEYGYDQNRAEIGRQPLVRVTLIDTKHGNAIAAVGYVRFIIVDTKTTAKPYTETKPYEYTDVYNLVCNDDQVFSHQLTWSQVEETIIAKLNISKESFESNYELECSSTNIASQFVSNEINAKTFSDVYGSSFGQIELKADPVNAGTSVLAWTVNNQDAYNYFKNAGNNGTVTVYIRYKHKTNGSRICVPFTWTPSAINITPTASIVDADKIGAYWYAKGNKTAGSGYEEIHGNVAVAYQDYTTSAGHYIFDVTSTFEGNTVKLNGLASEYSKLTVTPEFRFVTPDVTTVTGYSGKSYVLSASASGTDFLAAPASNPSATVTIATIVPSTGVVTYKDNDTAIDLLNHADHSQLADGQTLTGKIAIKAPACQPAGEVALTNNTFDVKFLRPATAEGGTASVTDGETGGSTAPVTMKFTDWRGHDFNNRTQTKSRNYYSFYGITTVTPDYSGMTTNMTGTWKKLSDVTNKLQITYTAPTGNIADEFNSGNFGSISYKNNGNTIGTCQVKIPLTVKYDWGELKTEITVTINSTIGNGAHRR